MPTKEWRKANVEKVRKYRRDWYDRNTEGSKNKVYLRRQELSKWFKQLKETLVCNRCLENHPACLEFHHIDKKDKESTISLAVANGWSKEHILEEIEKCEVLCANCHRKEHYSI